MSTKNNKDVISAQVFDPDMGEEGEWTFCDEALVSPNLDDELATLIGLGLLHKNMWTPGGDVYISRETPQGEVRTLFDGADVYKIGKTS
jgi:hypothetical protein